MCASALDANILDVPESGRSDIVCFVYKLFFGANSFIVFVAMQTLVGCRSHLLVICLDAPLGISSFGI